MHVQDRVNLIFFAPIQHLIQNGKSFFHPDNLRLFRQKQSGTDRQTYRIISHLCHQPDIFLCHIIFRPADPVISGIPASAKFPNRCLHRSSALKPSRQGKIVKIRIFHKQRHTTDHKSFRIHPVSHAPATQNNGFSISVYHPSSVRMKKTFYSVS